MGVGSPEKELKSTSLLLLACKLHVFTFLERDIMLHAASALDHFSSSAASKCVEIVRDSKSNLKVCNLRD
jgi:hypothetical protein